MRNIFGFACVLVLSVAIAAYAAEPATQSAQPGLQWYKGNTHTHTLWSDGTHLPEQAVEWYKSHGYQFLALTDHDTLQEGQRWREVSIQEERFKVLTEARKSYGEDWVQTRPGTAPASGATAPATTAPAEPGIEVRLKTLDELRSKFEEPGKFLLIPGEEFSDRAERLPLHLCALNIQAVLVPPLALTGSKAASRKMQQGIAEDIQIVREHAATIKRPVLVTLNHPNFRFAQTAEDLAGADVLFVEVMNGARVNNWGDARHISVECMWDIANSLRIARGAGPLLGVGSDDAHCFAGTAAGSPGLAWIVVRAEALSTESLFDAMGRGDFYFSTGVALADVRYDRRKGAFTVEVQPEEGAQYTIQFIGTPQDADLSPMPATAPAATAPATATATTTSTLASAPAGRITRTYSDRIGQVLQEVAGTRATYTLTGKDLFVRAVVRSDKPSAINPAYPQQAWCQPFGWENRVRNQ